MSNFNGVFATARGPIRWLLAALGAGAITMPWRKVYVLDRYMDNESLLRHELVHIEQIDRDGPWKFSILYLYWLLRYGYWNNPYEVDAHRKEPVAS